MKQKRIGIEIRSTHNFISRIMSSHALAHISPQISRIQVSAIEYLANQAFEGKETFQKDLEEELGVKRSAISLMLTNMEKNGLIVRESGNKDSRMKKIVLTEKAESLRLDMIEKCDSVEKYFLKSFSEDEIKSLSNMLERIRNNLKELENNHEKCN